MASITSTRELPCVLTKKEVYDLSKQLAERSQELARVEAKKKTVVAEYAAKIKKIQADIGEISQKVATEQEHRRVQVEARYDWDNYMKIVVRTDTNESIDTQEIAEHDRQTFLPEATNEDEEAEGDEPDKSRRIAGRGNV